MNKVNERAKTVSSNNENEIFELCFVEFNTLASNMEADTMQCFVFWKA